MAPGCSQIMTWAPILAAVAATVSVVCAALSYRLNRTIHRELKLDDRVIFGTPIQPNLRTPKHAQSVLQFAIFNKSKRKAYISALAVYDRRNLAISVTWSDAIDDLGMPQNPSNLVGVVDSSTLYVRRNDGEEFEFARLLLSHSFSDIQTEVIFDPFALFLR